MVLAMADSKIVRQLRFTNGAIPGSNDPIRNYGSGRHVNPMVTPGAPEGPTAASMGQEGVSRPVPQTPNPSTGGLTRRPGVVAVTAGMGDNPIRRAQAPTDIARAANPGMHMPGVAGVSAQVMSAAAQVRAVVTTNGFTSEQRNLLDMLLDDFAGTHSSQPEGPDGKPRPGNAELVALARETRDALGRVPVIKNQSAADIANGPARPKRVEQRPTVPGGGTTNPPGDVRIFAPNTQPFETTNGRQQ